MKGHGARPNRGLPMAAPRSALAEFAESVRGVSDIEVRFMCDNGVVAGNDRVATQLYRIAQEALRNALEHGQSTTVAIRLEQDARGLTLSVEDDGRGMVGTSAKGSGLGQSIMHHRAELIGANLRVESVAGEGTKVVCHLPTLPPASEAG